MTAADAAEVVFERYATTGLRALGMLALAQPVLRCADREPPPYQGARRATRRIIVTDGVR